MAPTGVVRTERRGSVDISRPVEDRLRRIAAAVGAAAVVTGIAGLVVWRPSVLGFPDAGIFFVCAVAVTAGLLCLSFALYGGEWVVCFESSTGTVREELRTFGNFAAVHNFLFEDLSGLRAVRDDGEQAYRLFMVEAENGRPLHLADFADEDTMRLAARAITAVHPGLRVG